MKYAPVHIIHILFFSPVMLVEKLRVVSFFFVVSFYTTTLLLLLIILGFLNNLKIYFEILPLFLIFLQPKSNN